MYCNSNVGMYICMLAARKVGCETLLAELYVSSLTRFAMLPCCWERGCLLKRVALARWSHPWSCKCKQKAWHLMYLCDPWVGLLRLLVWWTLDACRHSCPSLCLPAVWCWALRSSLSASVLTWFWWQLVLPLPPMVRSPCCWTLACNNHCMNEWWGGCGRYWHPARNSWHDMMNFAPPAYEYYC